MIFNFETNTIEENVDNRPYQVYSRRNYEYIDCDPNDTRFIANVLSNLAQVTFDVHDQIEDGTNSGLFVNLTLVETLSMVVSASILVKMTNTTQFGNIFNAFMVLQPDKDVRDFVSSLVVAEPTYVRSSGERILIKDMNDNHLYYALRRRLIDNYAAYAFDGLYKTAETSLDKYNTVQLVYDFINKIALVLDEEDENLLNELTFRYDIV